VARERVEADDGQRDARVAPAQATAGLWHHRLPGGGGRDAVRNHVQFLFLRLETWCRWIIWIWETIEMESIDIC
jgi:hypothetical protein